MLKNEKKPEKKAEEKPVTKASTIAVSAKDNKNLNVSLEKLFDTTLKPEHGKLREQLLALTDNEAIVVFTAIQTLRKLLQGTDYPEPFKAAVLNAINSLTIPELLLDLHALESGEDKAAKKSTKANLLKANHLVFKRLNEIIKSLTDLITDLSKKQDKKMINPVVEQLKLLIKHYQDYREQCCQASFEQRAPLFQHRPYVTFKWGNEIEVRYLKQDAADCMMGSKLKVNMKEKHGRHYVAHLNDAYFKRNPVAPGVEFIIDNFNKFLAGQGSTPSMLIVVTFNREAVPVLASLGVMGLSLKELLETNEKALFDILDAENFTALVCASFSTHPSDNKPDNFIVSADKKGVLTNIDQDEGLADSFIVTAQGKLTVNEKEILYFFPQMDHAVTRPYQERRAKENTVKLLLNWLYQAQLQNHYYYELRDLNIINAEQWQELQLPIRFVPGFISKLYRELTIIKQSCQALKPPTPREIFQKVNPLLARFYSNYQKNHPDKTINELFHYFFNDHDYDVKQLLQLDPTHPDDIILEQQLSATKATPFDFMDKRTQSIEEAVEELLSGLNFAVLSDEHQQQVLQALPDFPNLQHLTLQNCTIIDDIALKNCVEKLSRLTEVKLVNCPRLTEIGVKWVLELRPAITLFVTQNAKIAAKKWPYHLISQHVRPEQQPDINLILSDNYIVNLKPRHSMTAFFPLHEAAQKGSLTAVHYIHQSGYELKQKNQRGETVLHVAAAMGQAAIVQWLLEQQPDLINQADTDRKMPLHHAVVGNFFTVVDILLKKGAQRDAKNSGGETVFHVAALRGLLEMMVLLLKGLPKEEQKRLLMIGDDTQRIPLHLAAFNSDPTLLLFILNYYGFDSNSCNKFGYTPLHFAAREGLINTIGVLLAKGANLQQKNNDEYDEKGNLLSEGMTALEIAQQSDTEKCRATVKYLEFQQSYYEKDKKYFVNSLAEFEAKIKAICENKTEKAVVIPPLQTVLSHTFMAPPPSGKMEEEREDKKEKKEFGTVTAENSDNNSPAKN